PINIPRKSPLAQILSLNDSTTVNSNTPILLYGYAYDLEDGTLTGNDFSWHSSQGGELGNGNSLFVDFPPGKHVVTLTAVDSDNQKGSHSISILVRDSNEVFLPMLHR